MTTYRLAPILPDHPSSQMPSRADGPPWVEAPTEKEPRGKVTCNKHGDSAEGSFGRIQSPWNLSKVTSCVPDDSREIGPDGGVMMESGDYRSIELDLERRRRLADLRRYQRSAL